MSDRTQAAGGREKAKERCGALIELVWSIIYSDKMTECRPLPRTTADRFQDRRRPRTEADHATGRRETVNRQKSVVAL